MRFFMADFLLGNKEKSNRDFAILAPCSVLKPMACTVAI